MKREDSARLLAQVVTVHGTTYSEAQVTRWATLLGDLDPVDCAEAIDRHYKNSDTFITPHRIRQLIQIAARERKEAKHNKQLFEPYDAKINPYGLPEYNAHLNVYGKALTLAAAQEAREARAARTLKQRPSTPIADLLDKSLAQPGKWTVFDLVHELGIEVPEVTGTEVADALGQLPLELEETPEDRRLRLARERARREKASR